MTSRSCVLKQMRRRSPRGPCKIIWSQKGQREEKGGGPGRSFSRGPPQQEQLPRQHQPIQW
eukprot:3638474-Amphidinium_carterae.1